MSDVSFATVALSALVSVLTGYVGAMLSTGWQRRQDQRIHGLALLAEIRAIQRGLVGYGRRLDLVARDGSVTEEERRHLRAVLPYWRHDTSVFSGSSARVGLFSPGTAIAILEFYSRVRWLDLRATHLPPGGTDAEEAHLLRWLAEHRASVASAVRLSRGLARALRRETPPTGREVVRLGRHARTTFARRLARLGRTARGPSAIALPAAGELASDPSEAASPDGRV